MNVKSSFNDHPTALRSAFDSASSQKDPPISKESRKYTESVTASLTHCPNTQESIFPEVMALSDEYTSSANNFEPSPTDMTSWVEDSLLSAITETLCMVPNDDTDEWMKMNRLNALMQLRSNTSAGAFSSTYITKSNEEMSPGASDSSETSKNLLPFKCNALVLKTKYDLENNDRPITHQTEGKTLELAPKEQFLANKESFPVNTGFHGVKPLYVGEELVCKSTNQKLYHMKESQPKDSYAKNSRFETKNRNCCEPRTEKKHNLAKLPSYNVASLMGLKSSTGFLDSHCHLDLLFSDENFHGTYADYIAQHKDSYPNSYSGCVTVFCKPWTFAKEHMWRKLLEQDDVWGAFGCHPKQAKYYNRDVERYLEHALDHPKVKALGEIGLDYSKNNERSKKEQHSVFRRQLKIAQSRKMRVVIHCRDADDDAIEIMHEILPKDAIFHLHCFTGSWEKAQKWIENFPNVHIGITNLVTFPSAVETHEVARHLPLNRLLLETDAPFFIPKKAPRGTRHSHPGMAIHVAAQIAAIKDIPVDEVLQATCNNTRFVYNIP
ncbi:unnamed protein product [Larinioides sclopetarius]|uniref:Uncharacterized protein n=1 Tax=Larinioides sclopetarius TaxID=280406 RepID=A0AAV2BUS8_9ARAC